MERLLFAVLLLQVNALGQSLRFTAVYPTHGVGLSFQPSTDSKWNVDWFICPLASRVADAHAFQVAVII